MKLQFNFHRKTGLNPSYGIHIHKYGIGFVVILRVYWQAFTLTVLKNTRKNNKVVHNAATK